jgi:hypothetical protein
MQQQMAAATVQYTSHQFRQFTDLRVQQDRKSLYLHIISIILFPQTILYVVMYVTVRSAYTHL